MPTTITKRLEWDAAHRVLRHESKCATIHGHRYAAEITCTADELDGLGRVIDFGVIKAMVGKWIDNTWDHTTLVNSEDTALLELCLNEHVKLGKRAPYVFHAEPTAEIIAHELYSVASTLLKGTGVTVAEVTIYETPTSRAAFRPQLSLAPKALR